MIKGAVANLLNTYLGQFVEDFGHLDVKAWSGEVNLRNIRIRAEALDMLQLPVTISAGTIGRIHLAADWRSLKSKPVRLVLEDISACARPKTTFDVEPEVLKAKTLAEKTAKLAKLQETQLSSSSTDEGQAPSGMMARLAATIAANLVIEIRRVHVRYEAPLTASQPNRRFAAGLVLDSLTAHTTNAAGDPLFVQHSFETLFKRIRWEGLAIYVDPTADATTPGAKQSQSMPTPAPFAAPGSKAAPAPLAVVASPPPLPTIDTAASAYLCQPLCGTLMARLVRVLSEITPCRVHLTLSVDERTPLPPGLGASASASGLGPPPVTPSGIASPSHVVSPTAASAAAAAASAAVSLSFSHPQLAPLLALVDTVATAQEKLALLTAAESAHLTPLSAEQQARYTTLYKRRFDGVGLRLTQPEIDELTAMETDGPFEDLARARSRAFIEMQRASEGRTVKLRSEKVAPEKQGFFGRIFGKSAASASAALANAAATDAFTAEERAEIEGMLDASWESAMDVRAAHVDPHFELLVVGATLPSVAVTITGSDGPLLQLQSNGVTAQMAQRPTSTSFAFAVQSFTVTDAAPHVTFHRTILAPRAAAAAAAAAASAGSATSPSGRPQPLTKPPPLLAVEYHQAPPAHVLAAFRSACGLASVPLPPDAVARTTAGPAGTPAKPSAAAAAAAAAASNMPGLLFRLDLQSIDVAVDARVAASVAAFAIPVAAAARTVIEAAMTPAPMGGDAAAAGADAADATALGVQSHLRSLAMTALSRVFAAPQSRASRARPELELAVTVRAPTVIVPTAADRPHCDLLVVDLGAVTLTSERGRSAVDRQRADVVLVEYEALQAWLVRGGALWRPADNPYGNYASLPSASAGVLTRQGPAPPAPSVAALGGAHVGPGRAAAGLGVPTAVPAPPVPRRRRLSYDAAWARYEQSPRDCWLLLSTASKAHVRLSLRTHLRFRDLPRVEATGSLPALRLRLSTTALARLSAAAQVAVPRWGVLLRVLEARDPMSTFRSFSASGSGARDPAAGLLASGHSALAAAATAGVLSGSPSRSVAGAFTSGRGMQRGVSEFTAQLVGGRHAAFGGVGGVGTGGDDDDDDDDADIMLGMYARLAPSSSASAPSASGVGAVLTREELRHALGSEQMAADVINEVLRFRRRIKAWAAANGGRSGGGDYDSAAAAEAAVGFDLHAPVAGSDTTALADSAVTDDGDDVDTAVSWVWFHRWAKNKAEVRRRDKLLVVSADLPSVQILLFNDALACVDDPNAPAPTGLPPSVVAALRRAVPRDAHIGTPLLIFSAHLHEASVSLTQYKFSTSASAVLTRVTATDHVHAPAAGSPAAASPAVGAIALPPGLTLLSAGSVPGDSVRAGAANAPLSVSLEVRRPDRKAALRAAQGLAVSDAAVLNSPGTGSASSLSSARPVPVPPRPGTAAAVASPKSSAQSLTLFDPVAVARSPLGAPSLRLEQNIEIEVGTVAVAWTPQSAAVLLRSLPLSSIIAALREARAVFADEDDSALAAAAAGNEAYELSSSFSQSVMLSRSGSSAPGSKAAGKKRRVVRRKAPIKPKPAGSDAAATAVSSPSAAAAATAGPSSPGSSVPARPSRPGARPALPARPARRNPSKLSSSATADSEAGGNDTLALVAPTLARKQRARAKAGAAVAVEAARLAAAEAADAFALNPEAAVVSLSQIFFRITSFTVDLRVHAPAPGTSAAVSASASATSPPGLPRSPTAALAAAHAAATAIASATCEVFTWPDGTAAPLPALATVTAFTLECGELGATLQDRCSRVPSPVARRLWLASHLQLRCSLSTLLLREAPALGASPSAEPTDVLRVYSGVTLPPAASLMPYSSPLMYLVFETRGFIGRSPPPAEAAIRLRLGGLEACVAPSVAVRLATYAADTVEALEPLDAATAAAETIVAVSAASSGLRAGGVFPVAVAAAGAPMLPRLDIALEPPMLVIPQSSGSKRRAVVSLGRLTLSSAPIAAKDGPASVPESLRDRPALRARAGDALRWLRESSGVAATGANVSSSSDGPDALSQPLLQSLDAARRCTLPPQWSALSLSVSRILAFTTDSAVDDAAVLSAYSDALAAAGADGADASAAFAAARTTPVLKEAAIALSAAWPEPASGAVGPTLAELQVSTLAASVARSQLLQFYATASDAGAAQRTLAASAADRALWGCPIDDEALEHAGAAHGLSEAEVDARILAAAEYSAAAAALHADWAAASPAGGSGGGDASGTEASGYDSDAVENDDGADVDDDNENDDGAADDDDEDDEFAEPELARTAVHRAVRFPNLHASIVVQRPAPAAAAVSTASADAAPAPAAAVHGAPPVTEVAAPAHTEDTADTPALIFSAAFGGAHVTLLTEHQSKAPGTAATVAEPLARVGLGSLSLLVALGGGCIGGSAPAAPAHTHTQTAPARFVEVSLSRFSARDLRPAGPGSPCPGYRYLIAPLHAIRRAHAPDSAAADAGDAGASQIYISLWQSATAGTDVAVQIDRPSCVFVPGFVADLLEYVSPQSIGLTAGGAAPSPAGTGSVSTAAAASPLSPSQPPLLRHRSSITASSSGGDVSRLRRAASIAPPPSAAVLAAAAASQRLHVSVTVTRGAMGIPLDPTSESSVLVLQRCENISVQLSLDPAIAAGSLTADVAGCQVSLGRLEALWASPATPALAVGAAAVAPASGSAAAAEAECSGACWQGPERVLVSPITASAKLCLEHVTPPASEAASDGLLLLPGQLTPATAAVAASVAAEALARRTSVLSRLAAPSVAQLAAAPPPFWTLSCTSKSTVSVSAVTLFLAPRNVHTVLDIHATVMSTVAPVLRQHCTGPLARAAAAAGAPAGAGRASSLGAIHEGAEDADVDVDADAAVAASSDSPSPAAAAPESPVPAFWLSIECQRLAVYVLTDTVPAAAVTAGLEFINLELREGVVTFAADTLATRFEPPAPPTAAPADAVVRPGAAKQGPHAQQLQRQKLAAEGALLGAASFTSPVAGLSSPVNHLSCPPALLGSVETAVITPTRFTLDLGFTVVTPDAAAAAGRFPTAGADAAALTAAAAARLRPVVSLGAQKPFQLFISDAMLLGCLDIVRLWDPTAARVFAALSALPVELGFAADPADSAAAAAASALAAAAPAVSAGLELSVTLSEVSIFLDKARRAPATGLAPLFRATAQGVVIAHTTDCAAAGAAPGARTAVSLQTLECWDLKHAASALCVLSVDTGSGAAPNRSAAEAGLPGNDCPVFVHIDAPAVPTTDLQALWDHMVSSAAGAAAEEPLVTVALRFHSLHANWSPDRMAELFDLLFSVTGAAATFVTPPTEEKDTFYDAHFDANDAAGLPPQHPGTAALVAEIPELSADLQSQDPVVRDSAAVLPFLAQPRVAVSETLPPAAVVDASLASHVATAALDAAETDENAEDRAASAAASAAARRGGLADIIDRMWPSTWRGGPLVRAAAWGRQRAFTLPGDTVNVAPASAPTRTPTGVLVDVTARSLTLGLHKDGGRLGGIAIEAESRKIFRAEASGLLLSVALPLLPPASALRGPGSVQVEGGVRTLRLYKLDSTAPVPPDVAAAAGIAPSVLAEVKPATSLGSPGDGEGAFIDPWALLLSLVPAPGDTLAATFVVRRPPMPMDPPDGAPRPDFFDYNQVSICAGNLSAAFQLAPVLELVDYILAGIIGAIPGTPPPSADPAAAVVGAPVLAPISASAAPERSPILDMLPLPAPGVPVNPIWGRPVARLMIHVVSVGVIAPRSAVAPDAAAAIAVAVRGVTVRNRPELSSDTGMLLPWDRLLISVDAVAGATLPTDPAIIAAAAGLPPTVPVSALRTGHELRAAPSAYVSALSPYMSSAAAAAAAAAARAAGGTLPSHGPAAVSRLDKSVSMRDGSAMQFSQLRGRSQAVTSGPLLPSYSAATGIASAVAPRAVGDNATATSAITAALDFGEFDMVIPQKHSINLLPAAMLLPRSRSPAPTGAPKLPSAAVFEAVARARSPAPSLSPAASSVPRPASPQPSRVAAADARPSTAHAASVLRGQAPALASRAFPGRLLAALAVAASDAAAAVAAAATSDADSGVSALAAVPIASLVCPALSAHWPDELAPRPAPASAPASQTQASWELPLLPLLAPTPVRITVLSALDAPAMARADPTAASVRVTVAVSDARLKASAARIEAVLRVLAGNFLLDPLLSAAAMQAARIGEALAAAAAQSGSFYRAFSSASIAALGLPIMPSSPSSPLSAAEFAGLPTFSALGNGGRTFSEGLALRVDDEPPLPSGAVTPRTEAGADSDAGSSSSGGGATPLPDAHANKVQTLMDSLLATEVPESVQAPVRLTPPVSPYASQTVAEATALARASSTSSGPSDGVDEVRARRIIFQEDTPWAFTKAMLGLYIASARVELCEEEVDRAVAAAPLHMVSRPFLSAHVDGFSVGWRRLGLAGAVTTLAIQSLAVAEAGPAGDAAVAAGRDPSPDSAVAAAAASRQQTWRSLIVCPSTHPVAAPRRAKSAASAAPGVASGASSLSASPTFVAAAARPVAVIKILQSISLTKGRRRAVDIDVGGLCAITNPRATLQFLRAVAIPSDSLDPPPCTAAAAIAALRIPLIPTSSSSSLQAASQSAAVAAAARATKTATAAAAFAGDSAEGVLSAAALAAQSSLALGRDRIALRVRVSNLRAVAVDPITTAALVARLSGAIALARTAQPPAPPAPGSGATPPVVSETMALGGALQVALHSCPVRHLGREPALDSTILRPVAVRAQHASSTALSLQPVDPASVPAGTLPYAGTVHSRVASKVSVVNPLTMTLSLADLGIAMAARDEWLLAVADADLWDREQAQARAAIAARRARVVAAARSPHENAAAVLAGAYASPGDRGLDIRSFNAAHAGSIVGAAGQTAAEREAEQLDGLALADPWSDVTARVRSAGAAADPGNALTLAAGAARAAAMPNVAGANLALASVSNVGELCFRVTLQPVSLTAVDNLNRRYVPMLCVRVNPSPVEISTWARADGWAGNAVASLRFVVEYHDAQSLAMRALVHETLVIVESRFFTPHARTSTPAAKPKPAAPAPAAASSSLTPATSLATPKAVPAGTSLARSVSGSKPPAGKPLTVAASAAAAAAASSMRSSPSLVAAQRGLDAVDKHTPMWIKFQVNSPIDVRVSSAFLLSVVTAYGDWAARRQLARAGIKAGSGAIAEAAATSLPATGAATAAALTAASAKSGAVAVASVAASKTNTMSAARAVLTNAALAQLQQESDDEGGDSGTRTGTGAGGDDAEGDDVDTRYYSPIRLRNSSGEPLQAWAVLNTRLLNTDHEQAGLSDVDRQTATALLAEPCPRVTIAPGAEIPVPLCPGLRAHPRMASLCFALGRDGALGRLMNIPVSHIGTQTFALFRSQPSASVVTAAAAREVKVTLAIRTVQSSRVIELGSTRVVHNTTRVPWAIQAVAPDGEVWQAVVPAGRTQPIPASFQHFESLRFRCEPGAAEDAVGGVIPGVAQQPRRAGAAASATARTFAWTKEVRALDLISPSPRSFDLSCKPGGDFELPARVSVVYTPANAAAGTPDGAFTLLPPLTLVNVLPIPLLFEVSTRVWLPEHRKWASCTLACDLLASGAETQLNTVHWASAMTAWTQYKLAGGRPLPDGPPTPQPLTQIYCRVQCAGLAWSLPLGLVSDVVTHHAGAPLRPTDASSPRSTFTGVHMPPTRHLVHCTAADGAAASERLPLLAEASSDGVAGVPACGALTRKISFTASSWIINDTLLPLTVAHGPNILQGPEFGRIVQESRRAPRMTIETFDDTALRALPKDAPKPKPGCEPLAVGLAHNACTRVPLAQDTFGLSPEQSAAWTVFPQRKRVGDTPDTCFSLVAADDVAAREVHAYVAQHGNLLLATARAQSPSATRRPAALAGSHLKLRARMDLCARFYRAPELFSRVQVTHLLPRYVVVNETPWPLAFVQEGLAMAPEAAFLIPPTPLSAMPPPTETTYCPSIEGGLPFYWPCHQSPRRVQIVPLAPGPAPDAVVRARGVSALAVAGAPPPAAAPAPSSLSSGVAPGAPAVSTDAPPPTAWRYGCLTQPSEEALAAAAWTATSHFTLTETGTFSLLCSAKVAPDGGPGSHSVVLTLQVTVRASAGQFVVTITPELSGPQSISRIKRMQERSQLLQMPPGRAPAAAAAAVEGTNAGADAETPAGPDAILPGSVGVAPLYSVVNKSPFPISIAQAQFMLPSTAPLPPARGPPASPARGVGGAAAAPGSAAAPLPVPKLKFLPPMLHVHQHRVLPFAWPDHTALPETPTAEQILATPARAIAVKRALVYIYVAPKTPALMVTVNLEVPGWSAVALCVRPEAPGPGLVPVCTVHPLRIRVDCLSDGSRALRVTPCPLPRELPADLRALLRKAKRVHSAPVAAGAGDEFGFGGTGGGIAITVVGDAAAALVEGGSVCIVSTDPASALDDAGDAKTAATAKRRDGASTAETAETQLVVQVPVVSIALVDDLPSAAQASRSASGATDAKLDAHATPLARHLLSVHLRRIDLFVGASALSVRQEISLSALQIDKGTDVGKSSGKLPKYGAGIGIPSPPVPAFLPVLFWSTLRPILDPLDEAHLPPPMVTFQSQRAYVQSGRDVVAGAFAYWNLSLQTEPLYIKLDDEIIDAAIAVTAGLGANSHAARGAGVVGVGAGSRVALAAATQSGAVALASFRALAASKATAAQSSRSERAVRIYFEQFFISAVDARVTTRLTGAAVERLLEMLDVSGAPKALLSTLGSMLQVDQMPVDAPPFAVKSATISTAELTQAVGQFYQSQSSKYVTNVLLSSSLLGNPLGYVRNIGESASRMRRPLRELGSKKHRLAAAEGVAVSTGRLVGSTVGGVFNIASNVTGSIASGVSQLVLDDEHRAERDERNKEKPKNALYGMKQGAVSFGSGLFSAVTGLVTQPVKGAKKDGAAGAAKGFLSAIVNLPTKVVTGTLDGVTNIVEGVGNTMSNSEARAPPFVPVGRPLRLDVQTLGLDRPAQRSGRKSQGKAPAPAKGKGKEEEDDE